jgi:periplasmic divalent cation tolerance protein
VSEALLVLTTAGSREEANRIAEALVERRLAACVNVLPGVRSIYRWQGSVHRDDEWLLVSKTRRDAYEALAAAIRELHSYDTPEIVALDVDRGDPKYLAWLAEQVADPRA